VDEEKEIVDVGDAAEMLRRQVDMTLMSAVRKGMDVVIVTEVPRTRRKKRVRGEKPGKSLR
jgi:hypothetical protein